MQFSRVLVTAPFPGKRGMDISARSWLEGFSKKLMISLLFEGFFSIIPHVPISKANHSFNKDDTKLSFLSQYFPKIHHKLYQRIQLED